MDSGTSLHLITAFFQFYGVLLGILLPVWWVRNYVLK